MKISSIIEALSIFSVYYPNADFSSTAAGHPFTYLEVKGQKPVHITSADMDRLLKLGWTLDDSFYLGEVDGAHWTNKSMLPGWNEEYAKKTRMIIHNARIRYIPEKGI